METCHYINLVGLPSIQMYNPGVVNPMSWPTVYQMPRSAWHCGSSLKKAQAIPSACSESLCNIGKHIILGTVAIDLQTTCSQ